MKTHSFLMLLAACAPPLLSVHAGEEEIRLEYVTAPIAGVQSEFARAIRKAMPGVVLITAEKRVGVVSFDGWGTSRQLGYMDVPSGQGSGFFIHDSGYILTNYHVVKGQDSFWITLHDGSEHPARVVGVDPASDLAVLKVENAGEQRFPALRFAAPESVEPGHWAIAIGAPFSLNRTVTVGIVSNKNRSGVGVNAYEDYIQTDASINPGNSGGPLLNSAGDVIGVNDFIMSPSGGNIGLSFAISSGIARSIAEELIAHGRVVRGYLGAIFSPLPHRRGNDSGHGVLVERVYRNSPAAGKLFPDDVVIAVNDRKILNGSELSNALFASRPGDSLKLTLVREGRQLEQVIRLTHAPETSGSHPRRMLLRPIFRE